MNNIDILIDSEQSMFTYRVAALIIENDRMLVAKHKNHECYYTVGGKVKMNETSEDAVVREVYEETGHKFEIDRLVFIQERFFTYCSKNHHEVVFFYLMKYNKVYTISDNLYSDQIEAETLHWLPLNTIKQQNIVPDFLKEIDVGDMNKIVYIVTKE
ncbi:MAG: NUDIX hydrolase [Clostridiales bacterium GWF2_38_85]|nr:MAG: NUDIX hydrolase [Clostridiales bacterium GWF2_38_85]HBL85386.1 NUDIX hydrolase [Clostridiales bacterium]